MITAGLRSRVEAWISDDPDPGDRAELRALLADGGTEAAAELADRFGGRLEFGTAGLRGVVAAGPNRMNRAVVRAATAALAGWLREREPGAAGAGVVIGAMPGTVRPSSPTRRRGCWPAPGCAFTCCRGRARRRCWRSRSGSCPPPPAS